MDDNKVHIRLIADHADGIIISGGSRRGPRGHVSSLPQTHDPLKNCCESRCYRHSVF